MHLDSLAGTLTDEVHSAQDAFDIGPLRLSGLDVGFVVDREVVEDVLRGLAIHAAQTVFDNMPEFVAVRGVVGDDSRVRRGEEE